MKGCINKIIVFFVIGFIFSGCFFKGKEIETWRKVPTIADIPEITTETKKNVTGLKALSENYVIKNVKKANELLKTTSEKVSKLDKKDKKRKAMEVFVSEYKEIVKFYMDVTQEAKIEKVRKELMSYYEDTVVFYDSLATMEENLGIEKEIKFSDLKKFEGTSSREDKLRKSAKEAELKNIEQQEKMIKDFKINYGKLIPEIEKVQADVDFFILTLTETAKVYDSAYKTVELSMNIAKAIDNIEELNTLSNLTEDVMKSWENLDTILDNLTNISDFGSM